MTVWLIRILPDMFIGVPGLKVLALRVDGYMTSVMSFFLHQGTLRYQADIADHNNKVICLMLQQ